MVKSCKPWKLFAVGHERSLKNQGDLLISNLCKKVHCCTPHGRKRYRIGKAEGEEMGSGVSMLS